MKKGFVLAALLSAVIATPSFAEESPVYVGALLGDSYYGVLGGYKIDKTLSIEGYFSKVVTPSVTVAGMTTKTDTSIIGVNCVGLFPLHLPQAPQLSLFGKIGLDRLSAKVTTSGTPFFGAPIDTSVTSSEIKLSLGGGAQYDFNKNFSARAGLGIAGARNDLYFAALYKF